MDVTERYQIKKEAEEKRYLKALTDVYDKIFELNRDINTVRCLHCGNSSGFKRFEGVAMQMDDALEKWIMDSVAEEDLERVRTFFRDFCSQGKGEEKKPPQISYRARASEGGYVSSEEAISFLWEDEPVNAVTLSRYRKVALRLKNTLEEYGISDVIETVDGKRRIIPEKIRCDLYEYLSGGEEHVQLFKGSYLSNYSWAETTLG